MISNCYVFMLTIASLNLESIKQTKIPMKKNLLTMMVCLLFAAPGAWAQGRTVTGTVSDLTSGEGLPGVNVVVVSTGQGVVTDLDGKFNISVSDGSKLKFSFIGYETQTIAVGARSVLDVGLKEDIAQLSEVVVVGYGQIEAKDATGAVQSIKSEDFNQGVIASPEELIQGKSAGVQITSASGEPGGATNIRIRGTSSVRANNNPLYVIDGVPLAGDNVSGGSTDVGFGTSSAKNPLNFLNPSDIASIDILKDASATAIYGSRGANGVIIITTKSGKGDGELSYSYNISTSEISKKYDLLNAQEFLEANPTASDGGADTDWQDQIFRTGISQSHNVSYSGAMESGDYRISFGYLNQEGIVQESGLERYTGRFNGNKRFINDKLKLSTQLTLSNVKDENSLITNNSGFEGDLLGSALKLNPTFPVKNPDGTFYQAGVEQLNPSALLAFNEDNTNTLRGLGNFSAEYEFFEGFSFKTVVGFDKSFSSRRAAYSRDLVATNIDSLGRAFFVDVEIDNTLWENYFTYDKQISESFSLNALVGYSYQGFSYKTKELLGQNFRTSNVNLMINNLGVLDYENGFLIGNTSFSTDELQSVFGRLNLSFADKYLITATLRADGSSRFGGNNKYGYFPSLAGAWRLSDEVFIPSFFTDLKLRAGFGITGNQEIPHNLFTARNRFPLPDFGVSGIQNNGNSSAVSFQNPDIKWETTAQYNLGFDFGLVNNRLTGTIDLYKKVTSDLLFRFDAAQPAANPFQWRNLEADVINQGVEVSLTAILVDNSDFNWTFSGNLGYNQNIVENFNTVVNTGGINGQGLTGAFSQRIVEGESLFTYYLADFQGFNESGQSLYTNEGRPIYTGKSPLPIINTGLSNNLSYKDFSLNVFFSGQFGQYVYNNTANAYFTAGSLNSGRNVTKDIVTNGEAASNAPAASTRFLEDASFLRFQNATLAYNVNTANIDFIKSLRISATGQNLFVITDYSGQDPEVNTDKNIDGVPSFGIDYTPYPRARTFTIGVDVKF